MFRLINAEYFSFSNLIENRTALLISQNRLHFVFCVNQAIFLDIVENCWLLFDQHDEWKICIFPHISVLHTFNIFNMPQTWGNCQTFCVIFPCFAAVFRVYYASYWVMLCQIPRYINLSNPLCIILALMCCFPPFLQFCKNMMVSFN